MHPRILIVAPTERRARTLADSVAFAGPVDAASGQKPPRELDDYQLMVWEGSPRMRALRPLLDRLPQTCHVVLALSQLDVRWVSYHMVDPRINHYLGTPFLEGDLRVVVSKLASGEIFGLDRHLPPQAEIQYRRITTYKERCDLLDEIDRYVCDRPLRGKIRRSAGRVVEELLMNAMYNAPVEADGSRVFEDVDPNRRIERATPRPVSVRFASDGGSLFISVRDRFGTFQRDHLARYLLRCVTDDSPIEEKKRGAGLGLYQIVSSVTRIAINVLPGSVAEFICILDPPSEGASPLRLLSVTIGRAVQV